MHKIGDTVWVASYEMRRETETCPVCFGKLTVNLTLGNDEEIILPCDYCGKGYESPTGIVYVYKTEPRAESFAITGMRIDEKFVEYVSHNMILCAENTFNTEEEALERAEEIAKEQQAEEEKRAIYIKHNQNKSYSWNAGYHLQCVKDAKRKIEYHERMAAICKTKARVKR